MTKEQQIEEMARDLLNAGVALEGADFASGITGDDHFNRLATKLYAAGYRKADEVRKETAREILIILHNFGGCDATGEWSKGWHEAIDAAYNTISREYEVQMVERDD